MTRQPRHSPCWTRGDLIVHAILSPFVVALLSLWLVPRWPGAARLLAVWPALLAVLFASELRHGLTAGSRIVEVAWAPSLRLTLAFHLDGLGLLFAVLITAIGALVVLYASRYLDRHRHAGRFHGSLFAFMGAMLGVALSDNVLTLFVFWELTGFTSFLLIGFEHERADARAAATQALVVTGGGGLALLAAGVLLTHVTGTASLASMAGAAGPVASHPSYAVIATLVLLAAFTKSAQVPFHFWLPNAMAAPTPVSAYLHSATMVKAGVYLVARMTPILGATPLWTTTLTVAGAATATVGAYRAVQETDLKSILAYSTVSALGILMLLLGVGTRESIVAALVYLVAHACYKGALFLVAGAIDHETGTRDVTALSGLRRVMPVTAAAGGLAALSMAGVPLTIGFIGKDAAYEALLHGGGWSGWWLALTVVASILLGIAALLVGAAPFGGRASAGDDVHEPSWALGLPPLVLAATGAVIGVVPWLLAAPIAAAAGAVLGSATTVSLAVWHGVTPALGLSVLTLLGVAAGYRARTAIRARTWKPSRGTQAFYDGALSTVDAIGQAIAPALHSASLRSYVMVIVVTTVIVAGTAILTTSGTPSVAAVMNVLPHEFFVVSVVIAGAIAAALARTTMAAVLSLGAVGYGVAMTFLLSGAPDLAMTQFSVETLTAVIYVLVFRNFPNLGTLSPRLVRGRDALIAAGIGSLIAALVLIIATIDTSPRLREFFVAHGPTLGHGRNIVNVILVDFRALDTLAEITVLATAAIGVRALLRLAAAERGSARRTPGDAAQAVTSAILRAAARVLMPLLLLFSVFLLLRGHNAPGGGFVGGLIAAAAFALYGIAYGVDGARRALLVEPLTLLGVGLLLALASGLPAVLRGQPYLTAVWLESVALGTPIVFDLGVYLVVTGVVSMMMFSLAEES